MSIELRLFNVNPEMTKITFTNPPLVELVLGIQLSSNTLSLDKIFTYYNDFLKAGYPTIHERESLPSMIERAGQPSQIRMIPRPSFAGRKIFTNKVSNRIIQIQSDRFLLNWRKASTEKQEDAYPHFDVVYQEFKKELANLFSLTTNTGEQSLNQFEITYVDHIEIPSSPDFALKEVFSFLNIGEPITSLDFIATFPRPQANGNLIVNLKTAVRHIDKKHILVLETTCRGFRDDIGMDEWFSNGRQQLVDFFTQGITEKYKTLWGYSNK